MTRITLIGALIAIVSLETATSTELAGEKPDSDTLKVIIHINFPDSDRQGAGLKNAANLLKEASDTEVEIVCHGPGIGLLEKARTRHREAVEGLIRKHVRFVACENTMREKSIRREDLLAGVATVPSGTAEVVRKQQRAGYAYFKP